MVLNQCALYSDKLFSLRILSLERFCAGVLALWCKFWLRLNLEPLCKVLEVLRPLFVPFRDFFFVPLRGGGLQIGLTDEVHAVFVR